MKEVEDHIIIQELRELVEQGNSLYEVVVRLHQMVEVEPFSRLQVTLYFTKAFSFSIPDLGLMQQWDIFDEGIRSTEEIDKHYLPIIMKNNVS